VIEDFNIVNPEMLTHQILPFLAATEQHHEKVLIHCSGGIGRTGQVLAAWLAGIFRSIGDYYPPENQEKSL
jgi:protein-tyrosine phosphatase